MGMITSVRAPMPVAELPMLPVTASGPQARTDSAPPVTATMLELAVQHGTPKPAAAYPQFMVPQANVEDSATVAAEAARKAYIKASIAAGISPLPLP